MNIKKITPREIGDDFGEGLGHGAVCLARGCLWVCRGMDMDGMGL